MHRKFYGPKSVEVANLMVGIIVSLHGDVIEWLDVYCIVDNLIKKTTYLSIIKSACLYVFLFSFLFLIFINLLEIRIFIFNLAPEGPLLAETATIWVCCLFGLWNICSDVYFYSKCRTANVFLLSFFTI